MNSKSFSDQPRARVCQTCGAPLPADAPEANCPPCLMQLAAANNSGKTVVPLASEPADASRSTLRAAAPTPSTIAQSPFVPRSLGDYELLEEIARGGMGIVYKARQKSLNRIVAVKLLLFGELSSEAFIQRFRVEAQAAASLKHPNIVSIYEIGQEAGQHYFSMEYVEGQNLAQLVRDKSLSPKKAAAYVSTIAEAIHSAHAKGILHRDLKPSNVLIDTEDHVRVTDFGLAKRLTNKSQIANLKSQIDLTVTGQILGTPNYLSPEQALGRKEISAVTDVYALGGILYYLLTTRPPFQAETLAETLQQVVNAEPVSPRLLNASVPVDLETICLKCLEKEAQKRYRSALDLADDLGRFLADEPIHARRITQTERAWRWCRRKPALAGSLAAALVLLLVVTIGSPIAAFRIDRARQSAEQARKAEAGQRQKVEASARALRRSLYLADMGTVQQALQENNLGRAALLIEKYFPKPGEEDLRGLEWRYLWQLCQGDETFTLHFNDYGVNNEYTVSAVTFSPDGRLVALASFDNKVTILDAATKRVVTRLNGYFPEVNPQTLTFSPDGKLLAAADKGAVNLWRTNDWQLSHRLESKVGNYVIAMAFSPDGQTLASSFHFNVGFWDVATGREKSPADDRSPALVRAHLLAYSPDAKTLAVAINNEIQLWDPQSRSRSGNFTGKMNWTKSLAWSFHWLAASSWTGDLKLWDLETNQEVVNIKAHPTFGFALAFSPDGNTLVTGGGDQKIYFWDVASLKPQGSASAMQQQISGLRKIATLQGHLHEVWAVAFSPDGQTLVSGGKDGTARFWSGIPKEDESVLAEARLALRFSDDGNSLLTMNQDWTFSEWDIRSRQKIRVIDLGLSTNQAGPVTVSSDGKTLAVGRTNGAVELWNLETRQRSGTHQVAGAAVRVLKFSPKDSLLLAKSGQVVDGEWKSTVTVLNLATGQPLDRFDDSAWGQAFSPDETLLAASMDDYSITVRNLATRREMARLKRHTWDVTVMAFSPDGKRLASASGDNTVRLWDAISWQELDLLRGHMGGVNALAFSRDGEFLASGSRDNALKLWDVSSVPAKELLSIRTTPHNPTSVLFSPDSNVLAVSGNSDVTGGGEVLLLRAPSFAEIDVREMAKRRETANVNAND